MRFTQERLGVEFADRPSTVYSFKIFQFLAGYLIFLRVSAARTMFRKSRKAGRTRPEA
jgi:hypothetical protein